MSTTITSADYERLETYLANDDRTGFYVEAYRLTGEDILLSMGQISSSAGLFGGTAWFVNEMISATEDNYDLTVEQFSRDVAERTLALFGPNGNGGFDAPTSRQIADGAVATWDNLGLGHTAPPRAMLALYQGLDGDVADAVDNFFQSPFLKLAIAGENELKLAAL